MSHKTGIVNERVESASSAVRPGQSPTDSTEKPRCRIAACLGIVLLLASSLQAQTAIPDWCRPLPRPEYKTLERVAISDAWFEVYKPVAGVFAIYEPHQAEEVISYLIVGEKRALLFDTGMGISDIKRVVAELTKLPLSC